MRPRRPHPSLVGKMNFVHFPYRFGVASSTQQIYTRFFSIHSKKLRSRFVGSRATTYSLTARQYSVRLRERQTFLLDDYKSDLALPNQPLLL